MDRRCLFIFAWQGGRSLFRPEDREDRV